MLHQNVYDGGKYFSMLLEMSESKPYEDKKKEVHELHC